MQRILCVPLSKKAVSDGSLSTFLDEMDRKRCRICGREKDLTEFHRAAGMKDGHRGECKACFGELRRARYKRNPRPAIQRAQEWRKKNPERFRAVERRGELRERDRRRWLNAKYGLTPEDFRRLLDAQRGACAICGRVMGEDLHVDHDHRTNTVRGLLCGSCNRGIGLLQENPKHLYRAAQYITDHKLAQYEELLKPLTRPLDEIPVG